MTTTVVNIKKQRCDVYVGRGTIFGNPYTHMPLNITKAQIQVSSRDEAIDRYKQYFYNRLETDSEFLDSVLLLKDKILGCYCHPLKCHADIIAEFLNSL